MVGLAGGGAAGNAAVAVGDFPGDDLAGAGPEQLAAPVTFGDLGLLVFGDHALDLGEQHRLRVVGDQPGESVNATVTPKRSSSSSTSTW